MKEVNDMRDVQGLYRCDWCNAVLEESEGEPFVTDDGRELCEKCYEDLECGGVII